MVKAAHLTTFKRNHDDKSSAEIFEKKDLKITKIKHFAWVPQGHVTDLQLQKLESFHKLVSRTIPTYKNPESEI